MKKFVPYYRMIRLHSWFSIIVLLLLVGCSGKKAEEDNLMGSATEIYSFQDSCQHLTMRLSLELPTGDDSVSVQMRDSLLVEFSRSVCQPLNGNDDEQCVASYDGNPDDCQAFLDYYGHKIYGRLLQMAMSDYEERIGYLAEDTTMTEAEKEQIMRDVPMWEYSLTIAKLIDAPRFIVYDSGAYCYYGGAHGGVTGTGTITFDRESGRKIERFVRREAASSMQSLIRKGLLRYYSETGDTITDTQLTERLQIEGDIIPLPVRTLCPNAEGDSLTFTYGQYEIACYADGMPSFTLSVQELLPYLTPAAKTLLRK